MSKKISNCKMYKLINNYNDDVYVGSNEIGFQRFHIELIEKYLCKNQCELNKRQGFYIRLYGTLIIIY